MDSGAPKHNEKMRLCPSCRMEISVLAVKCRFCGENVGRPRDETRSLTIDDLGGETIQHYAPSSSVMEAMEAFRSESEFNSNPPEEAPPPKRSIFGIGGKKSSQIDSNPPAQDTGMPQLDERSQALASIVMPTPRKTVSRPAVRQPSWVKKIGVFAGFVAAILILWIGGGQVIAYINRPIDEPARQFRNPAESMLAKGADPLKTLSEAVEAQQKEPHSKNREIMDEARKRAVELIKKAQYAQTWSEESLERTSRLANEAFKIDPSPEMRQLKEDALSDSFAYRMLLRDVQGGTATFQLNRRSQTSTVTVRQGDLVQDRFEVVSIRGDSVQLKDTLRGDRLVTFTKGAMTFTSP